MLERWLLFSATKKPKGQGSIPTVTLIIKNETTKRGNANRLKMGVGLVAESPCVKYVNA